MKIIPTPQFSKYTLSKSSVAPKNFANKVFADENIKTSAQKAFALLGDITYTSENDATLIITTQKDVASAFSDIDFSWFDRKNAAMQGYIIKGYSCGKILIYAQSRIGIMHAIATFIQIPPVENSFEIKDYPDFLYRGIKWLLWAETGIWSYDFGDGIEKMKERVVRGLDICLRFKINMVFFDAFGFGTDRFEGYGDFMKFCTKEARSRGIHLINGGYTMGYGLSGYNFGKHYGNAYKNQTAYPDGDIYECLGTFVFEKDFNDGKPFVTSREHGTCISNDALTDLKIEEIKNYIKETGIGGLYLHNMDSRYVDEILWKARCESCRAKWPNDDIYAKDGMAGAFAYFFDKLDTSLKDICFDDYNSAEDLLIFNTSPGYLWFDVSDEQVKKSAKFWRAVLSFMPDRKNVFPTFRELFYNIDDNKMRIPEILAETLPENSNLSISNFCGFDGFYNDKLFGIMAIFTYNFKGADAVVTYNGHTFQEPLQLFNAEYMWNCENSAFYNLKDKPKDYKSFMEFYFKCQNTEIRPDEIYGNGGMLDVICQKLYGECGEAMAKLFKLCGKNYECPVPYICNRETLTGANHILLPYRWDLELDSKTLSEYTETFGEIYRLTKKAYDILDSLNTSDYYILSYKKMLSVTVPIINLWCSYLKTYADAVKIFNNGAKNGDEILEKITLYLKEVEECKNIYTSQGFEPLEHLNGALCKVYDMFDLLDYNFNLIRKSILTNKRIPDDRIIIKKAFWW